MLQPQQLLQSVRLCTHIDYMRLGDADVVAISWRHLLQPVLQGGTSDVSYITPI
jgi:hypothetical protein